MKALKILASIVICLVLIIVGINFLHHAKSKDDSSSLSQATSTQQPLAQVSVIVSKAVMLNEPETLTAVGQMKAMQAVDLSFPVDGQLIKIYPKNGERVTAGTLIAQLDDSVDVAQLAAYQADLQLAVSTYNRMLSLKKFGGISLQMLDAQNAQLLKSKAQVLQQQDVIAQKKIIAPFDGVLGGFQYNIGTFLPKGTSIVRLVQEAPLVVEYTVPVFYRAEVEIGQSVSINSGAYPSKTFKGILNYISPQVNQNSGTITLQGKVDNTDYLLLPGMFVSINQVINPDRQLLMIPDVALMSDVNGQYVYKVESDRAVKVYVKVGLITSNLAEVEGNIKVADQVVVAGQQKLSNGNPIKIIDVQAIDNSSQAAQPQTSTKTLPATNTAT